MAHGICPGCKREFSRRGTGEFCSKSCREGHEERERLNAGGVGGVGKRMARGVKDKPGTAESHARGQKAQKAERAREAKVDAGISALLEIVLERARPDLGGEGMLIGRVRAVGDAKRAQDWRALKEALIDLAAVAVSWASRIDAVDGEDPLPPAHTLVPAGEGLNGHGPEARSVAERYADLLLDAASGELPGPEARATIERLLGVGL